MLLGWAFANAASVCLSVCIYLSHTPGSVFTGCSCTWHRRSMLMHKFLFVLSCSQLQLQLQSFTLKQLFSEESCSVVGLSKKISFQL